MRNLLNLIFEDDTRLSEDEYLERIFSLFSKFIITGKPRKEVGAYWIALGAYLKKEAVEQGIIILEEETRKTYYNLQQTNE